MVYTLMHKNIEVAEVEIDEVTSSITNIRNIQHPEHLPIGVRADDRRSLHSWWVGRAIPASRSGLREALEALNVASAEQLLVKCLGLSLSDQYWLKPKKSSLTWENVNFFDNAFSKDVGNALFGVNLGNTNINLMSPDNTSDGWLKKKWAIANGKRVLIKGGSAPTYQEPLNEVLASMIMRRIATVPYVQYNQVWENGKPYSVCEDFITPHNDLVSAARIRMIKNQPNHVSDYEHYLDCCQTLGIPNVSESIDQMLVIDYLIANTDRHFNNFGAVRNADTLEWESPAPIFDCGTSMWHNQLQQMIKPGGEQESKPFRKTHHEQIKLVISMGWLDFGMLAGVEDEWDEVVCQSPYVDEQRRNSLREALLIRIKKLHDIADEISK
ncbi:excisionase [Ruminococcaceae bacterium OttesenSCG-928-I18]|nr:excisionase [Ruminococcaceae bacterium OttesenSCG-928-I18]